MQHIETFDGKQYDFRGPPCSFTLVEPNNLIQPNSSFMAVGDVSISYDAHLCPGKQVDVACAYAINVQKRRPDGSALSVRAEVGTTPDGQITFIVTVNDKSYPDVQNDPFVDGDFYVKRLTTLVLVVGGFGFRVELDLNGRIYVRLDPFFANNVRGLCGNMNGLTSDDFYTRHNIEEPLADFLLSYSSCQTYTISGNPFKPTPWTDPCLSRGLAAIQNSLPDWPSVFVSCTNSMMNWVTIEK
jgi:hypothetical protein